MKNKESNLAKARSEKNLKLIDKKKIKFTPCKRTLKCKKCDYERLYDRR